MRSLISSILTYVALLVVTPVLGTVVIFAGLVGAKDRERGVLDRLPRWWAKALVWASGTKLVLHGEEHRRAARHVFVANHVSWCDVPVLASILTRYKFVAKAEIARIPIFGPAARAAGNIYIDRGNRKSAFESYKEAADRVNDGASVVVFAEGTRGREYPLRPFKKGPFVLAISAQAPIVPVVVHGTLETMPKGRWRLTPGRVDVHFLEPIPTEGMTYEDRDALAVTVRDRMASLLKEQYGIHSPPWSPRRTA